ncbi:MAG: peptidase C39 family protein [Candidatus Roizmanbacteria bacterium]|nr:peptidase C39 family protein [Candidatus Roizmanbacteria bacterium]
MKRSVPFFANTSDDTHCFQAGLRMVLKYFLPEKNHTWKELEKMTAKVKDLWTWPTQGIINLHRMGFNIVDIDDFDIEKFIDNGGEYMIERYGNEVGKEQIKYSDIDQERKIHREYINLNIHQKRIPELKELKKLLDEGYLVTCNVNSYALNNEKGYAGHFVVIFDYDKNNLYLHDPGLPPVKNRKVSYKQFIKAWEYPNKNARNVLAFRLRKPYVSSEEFYNRVADIYVEKYFDNSSEQKHLEPFLSRLSKKAKILDVGCGPGNYAIHLVKMDYTVTGIDTSTEMIKIAKQKVPEAKFVLADMRKMPFENNSFDGLLSAYSLIHIPQKDIAGTLQEFNRVLKPHGRCIIMGQEGKPDQIIDEPMLPGEKSFVNFISPDHLKHDLKRAGFLVVSIEKEESPYTDDIGDVNLYITAVKK